MKVKVKFHAHLKEKYCPGSEEGTFDLFFENPSTIHDIFERLKIDDREIGFLMLNDQKVQKDAILQDGDLVHIFSFVAGG